MYFLGLLLYRADFFFKSEPLKQNYFVAEFDNTKFLCSSLKLENKTRFLFYLCVKNMKFYLRESAERYIIQPFL